MGQRRLPVYRRDKQAADPKSAEDLASYSVESYIYKYQPVYGSPPVNTQILNIKGVKLSPDGLKARIVVDNLRKYYIHTIKLAWLSNANATG